MDHAVAVRSLSLLVPMLLTWLLLLYRRPDRRLAAATFLASAWVLSSSLAANLLAIRVGWWSFEADGGVFLGVPVDLWLGWALFWGAVPILAFGSVPLWLLAGGLLWLDCILMPASAPVVALGPEWLIGEVVTIALCLVPAQLLARWTRDNVHLAARCVMQVLLFSSLSLWVLPLSILSQTGGELSSLSDRPSWVMSLAIQILAAPAVLGAAAVLELYRHGQGTPFPWDAPTNLVRTGPYAYIANPMQLAMTLVMVGLGFLLGSAPVALAGVVAGAFGSGFAGWQEQGDLDARFGDDWGRYRAGVRPWIPRWRPARPPTPATLYYGATCPECSPVGTWFTRRSPIGLIVVPAEDYPGMPPTRITYVAVDGSVFTGVAALSKATDHLNLAWAWLGWACRLPGACQFLQVVVDAVGGGPRSLPRTTVVARRRPQG